MELGEIERVLMAGFVAFLIITTIARRDDDGQ